MVRCSLHENFALLISQKKQTLKKTISDKKRSFFSADIEYGWFSELINIYIYGLGDNKIFLQWKTFRYLVIQIYIIFIK